MKRTRIKIGDVFCVRLNNHTNRYFQFIARDQTQLGSDVIRVFEKSYAPDETPDLDDVINDRVTLYAHFFLAIGLKLNYWEKVGHVREVGDLNVFFRDTNDFGRKAGEEPVWVSNDWWVWMISEDSKHVGRLEGKDRDAYIGIVFSPPDIYDLMEGRKCPMYYPDFE